MKIKKTKFKGLSIIEGISHYDNRGYLRELLLEKKIKKKFKLQLVSKSKKNVIRGLHYQKTKAQGKYISVLKGRIFDVVVDLRLKSKTFGKKFSIILSEENNKSIYIPPGFAHGFQTLDDENIVIYSCTEYRSIGKEFGLNCHDKKLKIKWPLKNSTMTLKDKNNPLFKDINLNKITD